jgi:hypothetical protein
MLSKMSKANGIRRRVHGKEEGMAVIFAVLMLVTLTTMGLVISDISMMEIGLSQSQSCLKKAQARASSCIDLNLMAIRHSRLPSFKVMNLDMGETTGKYLPENTIECLVPALITPEGAANEGEGTKVLGKTYASNYSLDYYFRMFYVKAVGFAGPGCGFSVYDATNDPFAVIEGDDEVAVGLKSIMEAGMTYGPCTKDSPC